MTRAKNEKLLVAMLRARMTGAEVAQAAGVSVPTVSRLLNNRQCALPETARKLARVLKCTVSELGIEVLK